MKKLILCLMLCLMLWGYGKQGECFFLGDQRWLFREQTYIDTQLVLEQTQIDPAYVRAITNVANYHGANTTPQQVEKVLREKVEPDLILRLANIALLHQRGSIDPVINQPIPIVIEFKDKVSKENILRGLARQQEYEMKNGLGGLRLGEEINETTISAYSIGSLGIADLIILLTRSDTAPYVVKVFLKK